MRFNHFSGAVFGSTMLASLATGQADAAGRDCGDIDLTRLDVAKAFTACLSQAPIPTPEEQSVIVEIESRGCGWERDRTNNMFHAICTVAVPEDRACPAGTTSSARIGNVFDPENTADGRRVGTTRCQMRDLVAPVMPQ